jgi:hypothetical protein
MVGATVVVHCAGRDQEFQTDEEGLVEHAAFTQGAPFTAELKGFSGLASEGGAAGTGQEEPPEYDAGTCTQHGFCCGSDEEAFA